MSKRGSVSALRGDRHSSGRNGRDDGSRAAAAAGASSRLNRRARRDSGAADGRVGSPARRLAVRAPKQHADAVAEAEKQLALQQRESDQLLAPQACGMCYFCS